MHRLILSVLAVLSVAGCASAGPTPKIIYVYATPVPAPPAPGSLAAPPVMGVLDRPISFTGPSGSQFSISVSYKGSWACTIYDNCGFGHASVKQELVSVDIHVTQGALPYGADAFTTHDQDGNQYQLWRISAGSFSGTLTAAAGSRAHGVLDFVVPSGTAALWLDWSPGWASGPAASWALTPFQ